MSKRPLVIDPAREMALAAAAAVAEPLLPGANADAVNAALDAAFAHLQDWPKSQPETVWIVMRAHAPAVPEWRVLPYANRQALLALVGVFAVMARAFSVQDTLPEPKAFAPMRSVFERRGGGLNKRILPED